MEVADQIAEHAKDEGRHERVLLDGAADSATAFADVAARLWVTVQSLAHVARARLIGILGKLRRTLGHIAHRLCRLTRNALRCAFALVGVSSALRIGAGSSVGWHGGLHWGLISTQRATHIPDPRFTSAGLGARSWISPARCVLRVSERPAPGRFGIFSGHAGAAIPLFVAPQRAKHLS